MPHGWQRGPRPTFTEVHGYGYPLCLTYLPDPDIAFLGALHRGRAGVSMPSGACKAAGLSIVPMGTSPSTRPG